jgi:hypothetical protein
VLGNVVRNSTAQGIQFEQGWGGHSFTGFALDSLLIEQNIVHGVHGGGIWGTTAMNVTIRGSQVFGSGDAGLDLEHCRRSTIARGRVAGKVDAHIADVFLSCADASVLGNYIRHHHTVLRLGLAVDSGVDIHLRNNTLGENASMRVFNGAAMVIGAAGAERATEGGGASTKCENQAGRVLCRHWVDNSVGRAPSGGS